jgi:hypothetical protein
MKIDDWTLVHKKTQVEINVGDAIVDFRGEQSKLTGGNPPYRAGTTGAVLDGNGYSYYPSVFDLEWKKDAPAV